MKHKYSFLFYIILCLISSSIFGVLSSCENSKSNDLHIECNFDKKRQIISTFSDVQGRVLFSEDSESGFGCSGDFTLLGGPMVKGRNLHALLPCNLPQEFQRDGLSIEFSGYLYETFPTENICAQIFQLTQISQVP